MLTISLTASSNPECKVSIGDKLEAFESSDLEVKSPGCKLD